MIEIYTDGSCLKNPGPGAYAVLILHNDKEKVLKGREQNTTNNRMEMMAIIKALEFVNENKITQEINLYSDSRLIVQTLNLGWKRKANLDLWQMLDKELQSVKDIKFNWVKGHADNKYNNKVDEIAQTEARKVKPTKKKSEKKLQFTCSKCGKETNGRIGLKPETEHIRVDCTHCGAFIKFASHEKELLKKARKRILISDKELEKLKEKHNLSKKQIQEFKGLTLAEINAKLPKTLI